jgi:hypothetical protein
MNLFKSLSTMSLAAAVLGGAILAPSAAHASAKSTKTGHPHAKGKQNLKGLGPRIIQLPVVPRNGK